MNFQPNALRVIPLARNWLANPQPMQDMGFGVLAPRPKLLRSGSKRPSGFYGERTTYHGYRIWMDGPRSPHEAKRNAGLRSDRAGNLVPARILQAWRPPGDRICACPAGCCATPMLAWLTVQPYGPWKDPEINREGAKGAKVREGQTRKNRPRNGLRAGSRWRTFVPFAPSRLVFGRCGRAATRTVSADLCHM